jgi:hypothetical protein
VTEEVTIYRWAVDKGITPQVAYKWRSSGLPVTKSGKVIPASADRWLTRKRASPRRRLVQPIPTRTRNTDVDVKTWLRSLEEHEEESIAKALASLTFLRSQGRTLAKGSQVKFLDFVWRRLVPELKKIGDSEPFNEFHRRCISDLQHLLSTNSGMQLSYGQRQKSLNVFLKFYVDWASLPNVETASRLRPLLHCPLDAVVMRGLKRSFPSLWQSRIYPLYRGQTKQQFSLSGMTAARYEAWQAMIRELSHDKPVLADVSWALERAISGGV